GVRVFIAIVFIPNDTALRGGHAQQVEVIARNLFEANLVGLLASAEFDGGLVEREQATEDFVLIAVIHVVGIGEEVVLKLRIDGLARDQRKLLWFFDRQRAQQQLVHHTEDGRVRADAQRQRDDGN